MSFLANNLNKIKPSATLAITAKAKELKALGKDVIPLSAGEPDFNTPENIQKAAIIAIQNGETKYTAIDGTKALKQAIITKFKRENNLEYKETEISVGCGGKHVLYNIMRASLNPGDEVIIPTPYWVSYPAMVLLSDATPVLVETKFENRFILTPEDLEKAITEKTKWVILNSPSNPTGACYTKSDLKKLTEVLLKYPHVHIIVDDMYEHLVYEGFKFYNLVELEPKLKERTVVVNGVSKAYAMTGWRIGYAAGREDLIKAMRKVQSQSTSNPCSIAQAAAVEALLGDQSCLETNKKIFEKRRDLVVELINKIPGLQANKPEGAFYVFPSCKELLGKKTSSGKILENDVDFCSYVLEEHLVALVPGTAFGAPGFFRMSYALGEESLEKAVVRINNAVKALN